MSVAAFDGNGRGQSAGASQHQLTLGDVVSVFDWLVRIIAIVQAGQWLYKKFVPKGDGPTHKALRYVIRFIFLPVLFMGLAISDLFIWPVVIGRALSAPSLFSLSRRYCAFFPLLGLVISPSGLYHPIRSHRRARALAFGWISNILIFAKQILKMEDTDVFWKKKLLPAIDTLGQDSKILIELNFLVSNLEKLPKRDIRRAVLPGMRKAQKLVCFSRLRWGLRTGEIPKEPILAFLEAVIVAKREGSPNMTSDELLLTVKEKFLENLDKIQIGNQ